MIDRLIAILCFLWLVGFFTIVLWGCQQQNSGQIEQQTQGVSARVEKAEARIVGVNKEIQQHTYERIDANRDAVQNVGDRLSERLAVIGVTVMGLSYPLGNILWILGGGLC